MASYQRVVKNREPSQACRLQVAASCGEQVVPIFIDRGSPLVSLAWASVDFCWSLRDERTCFTWHNGSDSTTARRANHVRFRFALPEESRFEEQKWRACKNSFCVRPQDDHSCPVLSRKIIPFRFFRNSWLATPSRLEIEGRIAIVTTREAGMRWTPFRWARLRETTDDMADGEIVWS
jgi:hypothetical protein